MTDTCTACGAVAGEMYPYTGREVAMIAVREYGPDGNRQWFMGVPASPSYRSASARNDRAVSGSAHSAARFRLIVAFRR